MPQHCGGFALSLGDTGRLSAELIGGRRRPSQFDDSRQTHILNSLIVVSHHGLSLLLTFAVY